MAELAGSQPSLCKTMVTRDRFLYMATSLLKIISKAYPGDPATGQEKQEMDPRRWYEGIVPDTTSPPARSAEKVPMNEKHHTIDLKPTDARC